MVELIKRYKFFVIVFLINIVVLAVNPGLGMKSFNITFKNFAEMLSVIPPIFILLGLLDVWVKKETMMKFMGENSGFLGVAIAFIMGSAAAGPLYAAFPVAAVLLSKGSKLSNVLVFIGAWSTTKIPLLLFEASAMGWNFMITRLLINIPGIIIISLILEKLVSEENKRMIYEKVKLH